MAIKKRIADQAIRGLLIFFCSSHAFLSIYEIHLSLTDTSSSLIQTLLSVLESHQVGHITWFADYTAGREFHPAPKNLSVYQYTIFYFHSQ